MYKIRILRHAASDGLNGLVQLLRDGGFDVKKLLLGDESNYYGNKNHLVINWGSSYRGKIRNTVPVLNNPEAVLLASNKLSTLKALHSNKETYNYIPVFTESREVAERWITEEYDSVYCRTLLNSSQGSGIVIANTPEELVDCRLYVKKIPVDREIRVHVFQDKVIDFSQKKKIKKETREERGLEINELVRNHKNGWVFARSGVEIPEKAKEVSISAIKVLGLDFGAVDVVIFKGNPKILEVNTAPGMEGTTLEVYFNAIKTYLTDKN